MKKIKNKKRKFGSALTYFQAKVNGVYFLFTEKEVEVARKRAKDNPEDIVGSIDKIDLLYMAFAFFAGYVFTKISKFIF